MRPHSEKCGCDECERADAEERAEDAAIDAWVAETLNKLQRYGTVYGHYHDEIGRDEWGDYIRVDDLAEAFGLTIDGPFDEATGTSRGFRVK